MYRAFHNVQNWQPRSFQELHNDRTYFQTLLQQENSKHNDVTRQISSLEAALTCPNVPRRRKIKKQLSWYKHQLNDVIGQEKVILGSIGQLNYEMQYRVHLNQVEYHRRCYTQAAIQQSGTTMSTHSQRQSPIPLTTVFTSYRECSAWSASAAVPPSTSNSLSPLTSIYWPRSATEYSEHEWMGLPLEPRASFDSTTFALVSTWSPKHQPEDTSRNGLYATAPKITSKQSADQGELTLRKGTLGDKTGKTLDQLLADSLNSLSSKSILTRRTSMPDLSDYGHSAELEPSNIQVAAHAESRTDKLSEKDDRPEKGEDTETTLGLQRAKSLTCLARMVGRSAGK